MGPGPGVDDGVAPLERQVRAVVPATAKVRSVEVVRGVGHPLGHELAVAFVEIDVHELPVGFMVVDPVKPRAPVFVGEEKPVLAHGPALLAHHAAVVDEPLLALLQARILEHGRGGGCLWDPAAEQERGGEDCIQQARHESAAREATQAGAERVALGAPQPREVGEGAGAVLDSERRHETQIEDGAKRCRTRLEQLLHGQLALGHNLLVVVVGVVEPEAARAHVALDVHRKELLARREAHDRLERAQELEVSGCRWDSGSVVQAGHSPCV